MHNDNMQRLLSGSPGSSDSCATRSRAVEFIQDILARENSACRPVQKGSMAQDGAEEEAAENCEKLREGRSCAPPQCSTIILSNQIIAYDRSANATTKLLPDGVGSWRQPSGNGKCARPR